MRAVIAKNYDQIVSNHVKENTWRVIEQEGERVSLSLILLSHYQMLLAHLTTKCEKRFGVVNVGVSMIIPFASFFSFDVPGERAYLKCLIMLWQE